MDLKQAVTQVFNATYDKKDGYKLIYSGSQTGTGFASFIITKDGYDIVVDFTTSETGIFRASSHDGLLENPYRVKTWYNFVVSLENLLKGE